MSNSAPNLFVSVTDSVVLVKIRGRASFTISADFKNLIHGLVQRGYQRFILDLSECLVMDSTFLGVLAGVGQKLAGSAKNNGSRASGAIRGGSGSDGVGMFASMTFMVHDAPQFRQAGSAFGAGA